MKTCSGLLRHSEIKRNPLINIPANKLGQNINLNGGVNNMGGYRSYICRIMEWRQVGDLDGSPATKSRQRSEEKSPTEAEEFL